MADLTTQQNARHAVYVQRYAGYLANLFDPYITKLQRELKLALADFPTETKDIRRINRMLAEHRKAAKVVYGEYNSDVLLSQLMEFAPDEAKWQLAALEKAVDTTAVSLTLPAVDQVAAAVKSTPLVFPDGNGVAMLNPFIKNWEANQIKKVEDIVRTGFILGRTNSQITQDIAGKGGYLDNQGRSSVKTMVRTATNHASNLARQATFDDNDDYITGYTWRSTLDSRTSSTCKGLDGKVFKNSDADKRYPPAHINCRSYTTPVINKRYLMGSSITTKASKGFEGGQQVNANTNYYSWLKEQGTQGPQGRAFVMDILGKERGRLFLDGGLSADRFKKLTLDEMFQPIPLDVLREKQSLQLAFDAIDG